MTRDEAVLVVEEVFAQAARRGSGRPIPRISTINAALNEAEGDVALSWRCSSYFTERSGGKLKVKVNLVPHLAPFTAEFSVDLT